MLEKKKEGSISTMKTCSSEVLEEKEKDIYHLDFRMGSDEVGSHKVAAIHRYSLAGAAFLSRKGE